MARDEVTVLFQRLPNSEGLPLPSYQSANAAAMDVHAAVIGTVTIPPGEVGLIPTGLAIALPEGYEGQIRPRSGLAAKSLLTVINSPGTIDADYRGEVTVALINHGNKPFRVERGMRVAQLVVVPVPQVRWAPVAELPATTRGSSGFGHTGT